MSDARYKIASAFAALLVLASVVVGGSGLAVAAPAGSGFVGVPDANVNADVPDHAREKLPSASALRGSVLATSGSDTLQVTVTTAARARGQTIACNGPGSSNNPNCENPQFALVLTDDVNPNGRTVAVPREEIVESLGYVPEYAYGVHESGEEWRAPIESSGGLLKWEVPHFSTNTVTFDGEVVISASGASSGTTLSYDVSDLDTVREFSVNVTGNTATQSETESGTVSPGGSSSISIAGNLDPTGPVGGDPELSITSASGETFGWDAYANTNIDLDGSSGGSEVAEVVFNNPPDTPIDEVRACVGNWQDEDDDVPAAAYISAGDNTGDGSVDGTKIGEWTLNAGNDNDCGYLDAGGWDPAGASAITIEIRLLDTSGVQYARWDHADHPVELTTVAPSNIDVSADDGTSANSLSPGSSVAFPVSNSADSLSISASGAGTIDWSLDYTERTKTDSPVIEVNGNSTGYSGVMEDGQTESLSVNSEWIREGTNQVNVSFGSSLSGDAPSQSVGLEYSHTAASSQSVDYDGEAWTERYNVSKTWDSDRSNATLSIPFASNVVSIRGVDVRTDGGAWSSPSYSLDGTTLTVDIGTVSAGETTNIRANGSKVVVVNGSITVLEPTTSGNRLDSRIRFESWASDSYLSLGGTPDEQRIHYVYNETWSGADPYSEVTSDGYNRLHVPNAEAGSEARVSTIPVRVNAVSGDVELKVRNPTQTEPEFVVKPGSTSGDEVEFTYLSASTGSSYILWSHSEEIVRDSGTASSPVTLVDDDSDEILQFQLDDDGSSSSGGGAAETFTGVVGGGAKATPGNALFIGFAAALLAAVWFLSREFGSDGAIISLRTLFLAEAALVGLLAIETLSPASFVAGIAQALVSFASEAGAGVATAMPLALLVLGGVVVYWLRARSSPSKVVNFRLGGGRE